MKTNTDIRSCASFSQLAIVAALLLAPAALLGQNIWQNSGSGSWTDGANWTGGSVPDPAVNNTIHIINGGTSVLANGGTDARYASIVVGGSEGFTSHLQIATGGTLYAGGLVSIGQDGLVPANTGVGGMISVTGGILDVEGANIAVGRSSSGTGILHISNGGFVNVDWNGGTGGSVLVGDNRSVGRVVIESNGGLAVGRTLGIGENDPNWSTGTGEVTVKNTGSLSATIANINNGTLTFENGSRGEFGDIRVGARNSSGYAATLDIQNGATVESEFATLSSGKDSRSTTTVGGTWNINRANNYSLRVGDWGEATLTIQNGGVVRTGSDVNIGGNDILTAESDQRGRGTVTVETGGLLDIGGQLRVGVSGLAEVENLLDIQAGGNVITHGAYIGEGANNSDSNNIGRVTVAGVWSNTGALVIGNYATSDGGVTVAAGGRVTTTGSTILGNASASTGTLALRGGVFETTAITKGSGAARLVFSGGTLRAGAASANFLGTLADDNIVLLDGGVTIDTAGNAVTIGNNLAIDGAATAAGLRKTGAGALTLTGARYDLGAGVLGIDAGTLTLTNVKTLRAAGIVNTTGNLSALDLASLFNGGTAIATTSTNNYFNGFGDIALDATGLPATQAALTFDTGAGIAVIATNNFSVALGVSTTRALEKTGPGVLTLTGSNNFASGYLYASGGTLEVTQYLRNSFGYIGNSPNGYASVNVGGTAVWNNSQYLYIGDSGTGVLNIAGSGTVTNNLIAYISRADNNSSHGRVSVSGTAVWVTGGLVVAAYGRGELSITDSGTVVNRQSGIIGSNANSHGSVSVGGAGVWDNTGNLTVGNRGSGVLDIADSGTVKVSGTTMFAYSAASASGTLNLRGGVLETASITKGAAGGSATLNLDGGTLRAGAASTDFLDNLADADITLGANGFTFDTQGHAITIDNNLVTTTGSSNFTKLGTGILTFTGTKYDFGTGIVTLQSGTLWIPNVKIFRSGGIVNNSGAGNLFIRSMFNGGYWEATANSDNFFSGYGDILLDGTGLSPASGTAAVTINTAGFAITATNNFTFVTALGDTTRALEKTGAGILTLSGSSDLVNGAHNGSLHASGGTLALTNHLSAGDVYIAEKTGENAALELTGTARLNAAYLNIGKNGHGVLDISGTGAVKVTGLTIIGEISQNSGEVYLDDSGTLASGDIFVGDTGHGTLTIAGAADATTTGYVTVGRDSTGRGEIFVSETGALNVGTTLTIGESGTGALTITGSGTVKNTAGYIGYNPNSSGRVSVGGTGVWVNSGALYVGNSGTGVLTIADSSTVKNTTGYIGYIANSSGSVSVGGTGVWVNSGPLCVGNSGTGVLTIDGSGTVKSTTGYIGFNPNSSGRVSVSGTGVWDNSSWLDVGYSGTGEITIDGSATVKNTEGFIGYNPDSSGRVSVSGMGVWDNSSWLDVGYSGTGVLTIADSGTVTSTRGYIGYNPDSSGRVSVSGTGVWDNSANLFVGRSGTGVLTIAGSGTVINSAGYIGYTANSSGSVSLTGNARWVNTGSLVVGKEGHGVLDISGTGVVNVTGLTIIGEISQNTGEVYLDDSGTLASGDIVVGGTGHGTLTIAGAADATTTGSITIGDKTTGRGEIVISETGALTAGTHLAVGQSGTATLDVSGEGTVTSANAYIGWNHTADGKVTMSGTSTWTNTGALEVGVSGTGVLTLTEEAFITTTDLKIGSNGSGTGAVTVADTARIDASAGDVTVGNWGAGTLDIVGSGSVSAGNIYIGRKNTGAVTLSGTALMTASTGIFVGENNTGTLDISDGASVDAQNDITIGNSVDGNGAVTMTGSTVMRAIGGNMYVGRSGTGTLDITGDGPLGTSAAVASGNVVIGAENTGVGSVTVDNAMFWAVSGNMIIGDLGSGSLDATGTSFVVAGNDLIIGNVAGSTGAVTLTGSDATLVALNDIIVGNAGSGLLDITSGTLIATNLTVGATGTLVLRDNVDLTLVTGLISGVNLDLNGQTVFGSANYIENFTAIRLLDENTGAGSEIAALTFDADAAATIGGNMTFVHDPLTGSGVALDKIGAETLTLSGSNDLTGGEIRVNGGTLAVTNHLTSAQATLGDTGGAGSAIVDGGIWTTDAGSAVTVGSDNAGTLAIINSGTVATSGMTIGANATGAVTADGPASRLVADTLQIGSDNIGTLDVTNAAHVENSADTIIGNTTNASGTLNLATGATMHTGGQTIVGADGNGALNIADATLTTDNLATLGDTGYGAANLTGNATWTIQGNLIIGNSGTGAVNVDGANALLDLGANNIVIAAQAGSSGTLALRNNAQINAASITGGAGTSDLILNGMTLTAPTSAPDYFSGISLITLDGSDQLATANAVTFDTAGHDVGISNSIAFITGNGAVNNTNRALEKTGLGTLTYSGHADLATNGGELYANGGALEITGTVNAALIAVAEVGTGTLNITNTGTVATTTAQIGWNNGAHATANLTGDAAWTNTGEMNVGVSGWGELNLADNAAVTTAELHIGRNPDGAGRVNVNGAAAIDADLISVGSASQGTLNITQNATVTGTTVIIGDGGAGTATINGPGASLTAQDALTIGVAATGTLAIKNQGTVYNQGAETIIGRDNGVTGVVTVDGAGSQFLNDGALTIGDAGTGALSITGSSNIDAGMITMAAQATGAGALTLNTGAIIATDGFIKGAASAANAATLDLNGGTILAKANNTDFFSNLGNITLNGAALAANQTALIFDTSAEVTATNNFTYAPNGGASLRALEKIGIGTLELSGANNFATSNVYANAGYLMIGSYANPTTASLMADNLIVGEKAGDMGYLAVLPDTTLTVVHDLVAGKLGYGYASIENGGTATIGGQTIIAETGTGYLNIEGSMTALGTVIIGQGSLIAPDAEGTAFVGMTGTLRALDTLTIGDNAIGALNIDGTVLSLGAATIGKGLTGSGTVNVNTGGLWNIPDNDIIVGQNGTGVLNIAGGTVATTQKVKLGTGIGAGTLSLNNDGVLEALGVTKGSTGAGTLDLNGGTLRATDDSTAYLTGWTNITLGNTAAANTPALTFDTVNHDVTITQNLDFTPATTDIALTKIGTGTLTLSGDINFADGYLNAAEGVTKFTGNAVTAGMLQIGDGTPNGAEAIMALTNADATFGGTLGGTGVTFTKAGSGTLTLTADNSPLWSGTLNIAAGTLRVAGATAADNLGLNSILAGTAVLAIDNAGQFAFTAANASAGFDGTVRLLNGSTLALTDANNHHLLQTAALDLAADGYATVDTAGTHISDLLFNGGALDITGGLNLPPLEILHVDGTLTAHSGTIILGSTAFSGSNNLPVEPPFPDQDNHPDFLAQSTQITANAVLLLGANNVSGDITQLQVVNELGQSGTGANITQFWKAGAHIVDAHYDYAAVTGTHSGTAGLWLSYNLTKLDLQVGQTLDLHTDAGLDKILAAQLTGLGGLTISNTGAPAPASPNNYITLTNSANDFTGLTTVTNGNELRGGNNNIIATSAALYLEGNAIFDTGSYNQAIQSLNGSDTAAEIKVSDASATLTLSGSNNGTFYGSITGAGALVKTGDAGQFIGEIAIAGLTDVQQGILVLNGNIAGNANNDALLVVGNSGTGNIGGYLTTGTGATSVVLGNVGSYAINDGFMQVVGNIGHFLVTGSESQSLITGTIGSFAINRGILTVGGNITGGDTGAIGIGTLGLLNTGEAQIGGDILSNGLINSGTVFTVGNITGNTANSGLIVTASNVTGSVLNSGTISSMGSVTGYFSNTTAAAIARISGSIALDVYNEGDLFVIFGDGSTPELAIGGNLVTSGTAQIFGGVTGNVANTGELFIASNISGTAIGGNLANTTASSIANINGDIGGYAYNDGLLNVIGNVGFYSFTTETGTTNILGNVDGFAANAGALYVGGNIGGDDGLGIGLVNSGSAWVGGDILSNGLINSGTVSNVGNITGDVLNIGLVEAALDVYGNVNNYNRIDTIGSVTGTYTNYVGAYTGVVGDIGAGLINGGTINYAGNILAGGLTNYEPGVITTILNIDGDVHNAGYIVSAGNVTNGTLQNYATGTITHIGDIDLGIVNAGHIGTAGNILANGLINVSTGTITMIGNINDGIENAGYIYHTGTVTGDILNLGVMGSIAEVIGNVLNSGTYGASYYTGTISGNLDNVGATSWAFIDGSVGGNATNEGWLNIAGSPTGIGGTLTNYATGTVASVKNIGLGVQNAGLIQQAGNVLSGGVTNFSTGTIRAILDIADGVQNAGHIINAGDILNGGLQNYVTGTIDTIGDIDHGVVNAGVIGTMGNVIADGLINVATGTITTAGTITGGVQNAGALDTIAEVATGGILNTDTGYINRVTGHVIGDVVNHGLIDGTGTIFGNVFNTGTMASAAWIAAITGDLHNTGTASYADIYDSIDGNVINEGRLTVASGSIGGWLQTGTHSDTSVGTDVGGHVWNNGMLWINGDVLGGMINYATGIVATVGDISQGLDNSGHIMGAGDVLANGVTNRQTGVIGLIGDITGGLNNSGLVTEAGDILSGGILNTTAGTITLVGAVNGDIQNAGLITTAGAVTGNVLNSGTIETVASVSEHLANTTPASIAHVTADIGKTAVNAGHLTVGGNIGQGLANSGTTDVAGSILAGGIVNAGGISTVHGAVTGDASNVAQAIVITGSTITGNVTNAGLLLSGTGLTPPAATSMAGNLTNSGTAVAYGVITGSVANSGTLWARGNIGNGVTNTATGVITLATGTITAGGLNNAGIIHSLKDVTGNTTNTGLINLAAGNSFFRGNLGGNGGTIHYSNTAANLFEKITVTGDLSGSQTFTNVHVDLSNTNHPLVLQIQGTATGTHTMKLVRDPSASVPVDPEYYSISLVQVGNNNNATFIGALEDGIWRYDLQPGDGGKIMNDKNKWYLSRTTLSRAADAILGTAGILGTDWHYSLDSLYLRMGDLRAHPEIASLETGNLWVRANAYRLTAGHTISGRPFDENAYGLTVGADKAIAIEKGKLLAGGFLQMGRVDRNHEYYWGDSNSTEIAIGGYATWLLNDGWYVDATLKLGRIKNKLDVEAIDGFHTRATYTNQTQGMGVEVGRRLNKGQFWIEPSAQIAVAWINGNEYTTQNGVQVKIDDADAWQYRMQVRSGATFGQWMPYIKMGVVRNDTNSGEVYVRDNSALNPIRKFSPNFDGWRFETGAGVGYQIDATSQVYFDYEYGRADAYVRPWSLNLGYRRAW